MNLRKYQQTLADSAILSLETHSRIAVVCPTGSGKTALALHRLVPRITGPVAWVTHRTELAHQVGDYGADVSIFMVQSCGDLSTFRSIITDEVFGKFVTWLSQDRREYDDRLDYFEVRFNDALVSLLHDAKKKVFTRENRTEPFETDDETGELLPKSEMAIGLVEPFDAAKLERAEDLARLGPAINTLPPLQRRILEMIRLEFPIFSEDPSVVTIAKTLGKSDKTIRNQRDQALQTLRAILKGENPL